MSLLSMRNLNTCVIRSYITGSQISRLNETISKSELVHLVGANEYYGITGMEFENFSIVHFLSIFKNLKKCVWCGEGGRLPTQFRY